MRALFVSVNRSYRRGMSIRELEPYVERAWSIGRPKVESCGMVVAVWEKMPIAAWELRGGFAVTETWSPGGTRNPRSKTGLLLGEPMPIVPELLHLPSMRHGCATVDMPGLVGYARN